MYFQMCVLRKELSIIFRFYCIQISNYYVAAGMKTFSLPSVGGIGKAIADLIVDGHTRYDLHEVDISRFLSLHNNERYLRDRVQELPGKL